MNRELEITGVKAVEWFQGELILLDQRKLPLTEEYVHCRSVNDVFDAIRLMVVRGAPAIGVCAAYAVVLSARSNSPADAAFYRLIEADIEHLKTARPTAVNLNWALDVMHQRLAILQEKGYQDEALLECALRIHDEDIKNNLLMSDLACKLFSQFHEAPFNVMTHCNAGSLATGGYGTALGAIRSAWQQGLINSVFADETRPWLQGAKLTAWELMKDGIPVTINVDGAASWVIKNRQVEWVVVGADRIAANGDVANKIGTYALAIQARYHGAKVMVVAPSNTVDMMTTSGDEIKIEMRSLEELSQIGGVQVADPDTKAINPVFDVTPASLIDYIVTEKGVVSEPCAAKMKALFLRT